MTLYKSRPAFGRHNVTAREATADDVAGGAAATVGDFIVETEGYAPQWSPRDEFLERYEPGAHDFEPAPHPAAADPESEAASSSSKRGGRK